MNKQLSKFKENNAGYERLLQQRFRRYEKELGFFHCKSLVAAVHKGGFNGVPQKIQVCRNECSKESQL